MLPLAGFLEAIHLQQERHGAVQAAHAAQQVAPAAPTRVDAHKLCQTFSAYIAVHTDLATLSGLGLCSKPPPPEGFPQPAAPQDIPSDPLLACPVCAQLPAGVYMPMLKGTCNHKPGM